MPRLLKLLTEDRYGKKVPGQIEAHLNETVNPVVMLCHFRASESWDKERGKRLPVTFFFQVYSCNIQ